MSTSFVVKTRGGKTVLKAIYNSIRKLCRYTLEGLPGKSLGSYIIYLVLQKYDVDVERYEYHVRAV